MEDALRKARMAAAGQEELPALHSGPTWVSLTLNPNPNPNTLQWMQGSSPPLTLP